MRVTLRNRCLLAVSLLVIAGLTALLHEYGWAIKVFKNRYEFYYRTRPQFEPPTYANDLEPLDLTLDSTQLLSGLYEVERRQILSDWSQTNSEMSVKSSLGSFDPDLDTYIARLTSFIHAFFPASPHTKPLLRTLNRLSRHVPPPLKDGASQALPKVVYSMDKGGKAGVPEEFEWWEQRLGEEGWDVVVADDGMMQSWFDESTGVHEDLRVVEQSDSEERWKELWDRLKMPVLKSDLLRYMIILLRGGVYTDSDTSPLSHPHVWGTDATFEEPPALRVLRQSMAILAAQPRAIKALRQETEAEAEKVLQASLGYSNETHSPSVRKIAETEGRYSQLTNPGRPRDMGMLDPEVGIVVSIEYDTQHDNWSARYGYTRNLQIVQWTFAARPYHPILFDMLASAVSKIMARSEEEKVNWESILDSTGPGAFTDAVLIYLVVQYGVIPEDLMNLKSSARFGDVLVIPLAGFGTGTWEASQENWDGPDGAVKCVAHGFRGRWKDGIKYDGR